MALASHTASFDPAGHRLPPRRYAWTVFAILVSLMVMDYVDRQVVVSMFPHLKAHWNLSDSQLGALVSVVSITVAAGTIPLSLLADRWGRVRSLFAMALVWSLATVACAFADSYLQLLGARSLVGVGEAAYGSAGAALLASIFPQRLRSTVLGAFLAAGLLGSVLGVVLGGVIAQRWGRQAGFGAVGPPGLALAIVFLFVVRSSKVGAQADRAGEGAPRLSISATASALIRPRSLLIACVAAGLQLVMVSTTYAWLPSFLNRYYGLAPDQAGLKTGVVVLVSGLGAIAWSMVADRLASRQALARLHVCAAAGVATAILMFLAFGVLSPGTAQFWTILAGAAAMTGTIGPVAAVVVDVVHPGIRATAAAVLSLTQNLFGLAAGPLVAGVLSDRFGLPFAMSVVPLSCLAAAAVFLLACRTYAADLRNAEAFEPADDHGLKPQAA